ERLRAFLLEEVTRGVLQQLLFFRQSQVHLLSAFLSTAVPDSRRPLPLSDECLARSPDVVRRRRDVSRLISGTIYCFLCLPPVPLRQVRRKFHRLGSRLEMARIANDVAELLTLERACPQRPHQEDGSADHRRPDRPE